MYNSRASTTKPLLIEENVPPRRKPIDWEVLTADELGDLARHGKDSSTKNTALMHLVKRASIVDPHVRKTA